VAVEHVVGITAEVRVVVTAVDQGAQTVAVRVVDDNGVPITAAVTLPMTLVRVVGVPITVGDVLEKLDDGRTAVVRWVSPTDPSQWAPSTSGTPALSSLGWKKVGTFVAT
jgi:hypothetical protein